MFKVILEAEDGDYTLFTGSERQCVDFCKKNEKNYGEGQQLVISESCNYF